MFDSEQQMQEWLSLKLKEIEATCGGLSELIDEFNETSHGKSSSELRIINAYRHCLESLHINKVLSEDENISIKKGDVLKPDFLLYAPDTESLVILELKNIANPTRQVGTELGAYSSELKSHLPFISDADIIHVVIARDWPTLLRHYIFNEIFWMQRNILCLEPYQKEDKQIKLRVLPSTQLVEDHVSLMISPRHLGGYQLCLYDNELYTGGNRDRLDQYLEQLKTATAAMALKGSSNKSHGFAFLWKDHQYANLTPYNITILNLAPFQSLERFFHLHDEGEIVIPKITKKLIKIVREGTPIGHGESLNQIKDFGEQYLENICSPQVEGFLTWDYLRDYMLKKPDLIEFQSWGVFSELLSEKLAEKYKQGKYSIKLTDPQLGLELIGELVDDDYEFIEISQIEFGPNSGWD